MWSHHWSSELLGAEKETWNGIGKENLQEEQKGPSHLPDITSHVTPTHCNLSWVQVSEENVGFFQESSRVRITGVPQASGNHCQGLSCAEEKYPSGRGIAMAVSDPLGVLQYWHTRFATNHWRQLPVSVSSSDCPPVRKWIGCDPIQAPAKDSDLFKNVGVWMVSASFITESFLFHS